MSKLDKEDENYSSVKDLEAPTTQDEEGEAIDDVSSNENSSSESYTFDEDQIQEEQKVLEDKLELALNQ